LEAIESPLLRAASLIMSFLIPSK